MSANTHSLDLERDSNQYAQLANDAHLNFGTGPFTLECWYKMESNPGYSGIFGKESDGSTGYRLSGTGTYQFYCGSGGSNVDTTPGFTIPNDGAWHHIACVRDASLLRVYVDLTQVDSVASNSRNVDNSGPFTIGAYYPENPTIHFYDGLIDEVRIWNVARSLADLTQYWKKDVTGLSNLVSYWKLNNAYTDLSGNGHTLTPGGSPVFSTTVPFTAYEEDNQGSPFIYNML